MKLLDMFDKLDDIIYKPIELVTDWAREPLEVRDHKRKEQSADNALERELKKNEREKEVASEIKIREKEAASEIKIKEQEREADIAIRKETEIVRIITEIEALKKDRDFNRMKDVSEAISKYQKELTKLNVNAANAIANMQVDLRDKAQNLVIEKTKKYRELQKVATEEAMEAFKKIGSDFGDNEFARDSLNEAVRTRLLGIVNTAETFIKDLNDDLRSINSNIDLLAQSGQRFIERFTDRFQALGFSDEEIKNLKDAKEVEVKVIDKE